MRPHNAKGEYYLTDVVALAREDGVQVAAVEAPAEEVAGINSRAELAAAEAVVQSWLRAAAPAGLPPASATAAWTSASGSSTVAPSSS